MRLCLLVATTTALTVPPPPEQGPNIPVQPKKPWNVMPTILSSILHPIDHDAKPQRAEAQRADSSARAPAPDMSLRAESMTTAKDDQAARLDELLERQSLSLDELLDWPLLDPWSPSTKPWMRWFKELVRDDYLTAEALWVGLYCSFCVSIGMAVVRSYIMWEYPAVESCATVYCNAVPPTW